MKLQLDTTAKTVKIESDIKVSLLIKTLKSLLPTDWKEFTLQTNVTINNWSNPIYIEKQIIREREYPWYNPNIITYYGMKDNLGLNTTTISDYKTNSSTCELKAGIYNVEI
jgi:hypothetical protein